MSGDFCLVGLDAGGIGAQIDTDFPRRHWPVSADPQAKPSARGKYEVEQLLSSPGSLPPPMSRSEREAAIRSLLPTATFQMMSKVPRELLKQSSDDATNLRRKLARGSTVVFVTAGYQGKRFTFERAAALGIKSVLIDDPDSWAKNLQSEGIIAKFIPVDMSRSADEIFADCLARIRELGQDGVTGEADGVATYVELSVPLVARLAEQLGLPGMSPEAVDKARDKHATRAALKAAGLPTPRNYLIASADTVAEAAATVGFPAVLKPVSGAASLGVKKVNSEEELVAAYQEIIEELSTLVITSGALVKGNGSNGTDAANKVDLTLLLEQFLDGDEVDVDVVMSEGEWRYAGVADNGPTLEPYFNETWAVCPSLLPKESQSQLKELAIDSLKALGFDCGVFHVECKMTSTGPQLIEVNARMGGGQVHECNFRTWGVDLVEETLFVSLGIPSRPMLPKQPLTAVGYCDVNARKSGVVVDVSGVEDIKRREGVVWAKPSVKVGDKCVGPADGLPTWLCDLFVAQKTAKDALKLLQDLEKEEPVKVR